MSLFKRTITLVCLLSTSSLIGKAWVGGATGSEEVWNEPTNWSPVGVPQTVDFVSFPDTNFRDITIDSSLAASFQFTQGLDLSPSTGSYTFTPTGSDSFSWSGDTSGITNFTVETGGNNSFAVPLTIINNGTLNIVPLSGASINFSSTIADPVGSTGNVQIAGEAGGTVIFSGTNTYTGTTTLAGGTLKGGSSGAFPPTTSFIINYDVSTLDLNGHSYSVKSIEGAGTITNTSATPSISTLTTAGNINPLIKFQGQIIDGSPSQKIGLTVSGVNPLTLTGSNKYSGPTQIEVGGTLQAKPDAGANHGLSPNSDYTVDGTLTIEGGNHPTLINVTVINSLSGAPTGLINATNPTTLSVTSGGTFAGNLGEPSSASLLGFTLSSGMLTLAGESIYKLPTTISAGATLKAGSPTAFSPISAHIVEGTLDLNGNSNSIGILTNTAGVTTGRVETTSGAATLTITGSGIDERNFGGNIVGNISLTLGDVALGNFPAQTLSGQNTYLGTTTLLMGELIAGSNTAFSPNSDMIIGSNDGYGPQLNLGSYAVTIKSLSGLDGGLDDGIIKGSSGSAVLTVVDGAGTTFPGVIINGGTGTVGLTLTTGALTLTGINTYTGGTTINGGTLALANNGTIAATGPLTVNGIFDISQFSGGTLTVGNLSGSNAEGSIHLGGNSFTTTGTVNTTYRGSIEGTGVIFRKAGNGILTLAGTNLYTGTTAIDAAGTLALSSTGTIVATNDLNVAGTFDITQVSAPFAAGNLSGPSTGTIHLGSKQLTTTGSRDTTYDGIIDGAGGTFIIMAGSGILKLTGNNTYTGATTINAGGTLAFSGAGRIAAASDLTVAGTLDISQISVPTFSAGNLSVASTGIINLGNKQFIAGGSSDTTYSGTINGAGGSFTKTGIGTLTLEGTSTYTGATTISVGILKAGSTTAFSTSSPIILSGTATLDTGGFNNTILSLAGTSSTSVVQSSTGASTLILSYAIPGDTIYAGTIINGTGSLGITKNGSNTKLTLSGANTYSGTTTILAGTIAAGSTAGLSSSSPFVLSGAGTLDIGGFSNTILSLTGASGTTVTNTGAASTLTVTGSGSTLFSGKIISSVGLTLGTSGSLQLANSINNVNVYSGATTINGTAKLQATAANAFSPNSAVTIATGGTLDLNGFANAVANLSGSGTVNLGATGALTVGSDNQSTSTFSGAIQNPGAALAALTKVGTGIVLLSGNNTYTGRTTISAGTLTAGSTTGLASTSPFVLSGTGTLDIGGFGNTILSLTGATGTTVTNSGSAATLTVTGSGTTLFSGKINSTVGLTLGTSGTLQLANSINNVNVYSGATTINGTATLQAIAANAFSPNSAVALGGSGILDLNANNNTILSLAGSSSTTKVQSSTGASTLTLSYTTAGDTTYDGTIIDGTGNLGIIKNGSSALIITNTLNTYHGSTTINGGSLKAAVTNNTFSPNSVVTVGAGGTLDLNGFANAIPNLSGSGTVILGSTGALTVGSDNQSTSTFSGAIQNQGAPAGALIKVGTGILVLSGNNTYTGRTTISAGTLTAGSTTGLASTSPFVLSGTGTLDIGGFGNTILSLTGAAGSIITNTGSAATLTVTGSGTTLFSGKINNSVGLTLGTSGTLQLANSAGNVNIYSGATTINGTATLQATVDHSFSPNSAVALATNGTLDLNGHENAVANLSGAGTVNLGTTGALTIGSDNQDSTFSGKIQNPGAPAGALIKVGTGKLSLTGNSTYSGATTINEGELAVLGHLGTSSAVAITVNPGATLSGTGPITGAVTFTGAAGNEAICSPGASPGPPLYITGTYTMGEYSILDMEINPTISDEIFVTGNVSINPLNTTFNVIPLTGDYTIPSKYTVITGASVTGKFANFTSSLLLAGYLTYTDTSVILNLGTLNPITSFVSTGNGGAVAFTIDTVVDSGSKALDGIVGTLISLSTVAEIDQAMYAMQPALYKGATLAQQNNSVLVRSTLTERLQTILDTQHCSIAKSTEKEKTICQKDERKLHIWVNGMGDYQHQGGLTFFSSPQIGYKNDTRGLASGIDYNFCKNFYTGALGAYTHSDVRWEQGQGNADIDSGYAGLYLSAIGKMFYGNLSLVGAWSNFNEERNIIYPNVFKTANNSHHGQQLISHFDTGLNLQLNRFAGVTIRPFDSLDWIVQKEDAFKEHGAGQWDLSVTKSHANMLRNELGFNLATCHCTKDAKWTFDTKLSWVREMRLSGKSYDAEFTAVDTAPFTVIGYFPSRSLIATGASLSAVAFKDRLTCTVYYNGAFGKSYSENTIGGGVTCGF